MVEHFLENFQQNKFKEIRLRQINIYIYIYILYINTHILVAQLCLTLCNPMECSPPGSSVEGILQSRKLKWVAIPFSRGSSWPRDQPASLTLAGKRTICQSSLVKNLPANAGDLRVCRLGPWVRKIPWRRAWQPTPVFLPGESHGQRSLGNYSPQGPTEADKTEVT